MIEFQLLLVLAIPAIGLLKLWLLLDRWGKTHDPMRGSTTGL